MERMVDFMRLEYTEEQEKQLRITEIESILTNNLYENEIEDDLPYSQLHQNHPEGKW